MCVVYLYGKNIHKYGTAPRRPGRDGAQAGCGAAAVVSAAAPRRAASVPGPGTTGDIEWQSNSENSQPILHDRKTVQSSVVD